jgi:non-specific serine/threonine protein kinase
LAENRRCESHLFAFLATIALSFSDNGRVLYTPLGKAFADAQTPEQKKRLASLMKPLDEAAKSLPWLASAISSGDVFRAQIWKPEQAHAFLKSLAVLPSFGLRARVPDWWSASKHQVKAKVVVDAAAGSRLGADGLLQFDVKVALDDEDLSPEEWKALLASNDPLVRLRGRWVEVDKQKIEQALAHWKKAAGEAKDGGLSWHEGMRLLAGLGRERGGLSTQGAATHEHTEDWTAFAAGPRLAEALAALRNPDGKVADALGYEKGLNAKLRPYQERGVAWLSLLTNLGLGACLADDMGRPFVPVRKGFTVRVQ